MRSFPALTTFVAVVLLAAGCTTTGGGGLLDGPRTMTEVPPVASFDKEKPSLIIVLDTSSSMDLTDPDRFAEQGAQLALALAGAGDNVGVVNFDSKAHVLASLRSLKSANDRGETSRQLALLSNWGKTNFAEALRKANLMLQESSAPPGAEVIFLTDGRLKRGESEEPVIAILNVLRQRGAKIHTVALSEGGRSELLQRMATATGGSFRFVEDADQLLDVFITLIADVRGFLVRRSQPLPVKLFPGTKRLAFALLKEDEDARVDTVSHDGKEVIGSATAPIPDPDDLKTGFEPRPGVDVPLNSFYLYPKNQDRDEVETALEVVNLDGPSAGTWELGVSGAIRRAVALQEPPFRVRVEGPAGDVYESDPDVPIRMYVDCDSPEVFEALRPLCSGESELLAAASETGMVSSVKMVAPDLGDSYVGNLSFALEGRLPLQGVSAPDTLTINARLLMSSESGPDWTLTRSLSMRLLPGERPRHLVVEPERVELSMWNDDAPRKVKLQLSTKAASELTVRVSGPTGGSAPISVNAGQVKVAESAPKTVEVTCDPTRAVTPGEQSGRVILEWTGAGSGAENIVPVRLRVVNIEVPSASLSVKPGETFTYSIDAIKTEPTVAWTPPQKLTLSGPSRIDLTLETQGESGGSFLKGAIPEDASGGDYSGTFKLVAEGMPERDVTVNVRVEAAPLRVTTKPRSLAARTNAGDWVRVPLAVTLASKQRAEVVVRPSALSAPGQPSAIAPPYDIRVKPLDGFDKRGKASYLEPGKTGNVELAVYVSSDLPAGAYEGTITVSAQDGQRTSERRVPVRIEVRR